MIKNIKHKWFDKFQFTEIIELTPLYYNCAYKQIQLRAKFSTFPAVHDGFNIMHITQSLHDLERDILIDASRISYFSYHDDAGGKAIVCVIPITKELYLFNCCQPNYDFIINSNIEYISY